MFVCGGQTSFYKKNVPGNAMKKAWLTEQVGSHDLKDLSVLSKLLATSYSSLFSTASRAMICFPKRNPMKNGVFLFLLR